MCDPVDIIEIADRLEVDCHRCGGTGNEMWRWYRKCQDCGGTGRAQIDGSGASHV